MGTKNVVMMFGNVAKCGNQFIALHHLETLDSLSSTNIMLVLDTKVVITPAIINESPELNAHR